MAQTTMIPVLPGLIWAVQSPFDTVSALGSVRQTGNGFAFFGHPDNEHGQRSRRELKTKAGIETHLWERDGFETPEAALAHVNAHLANV